MNLFKSKSKEKNPNDSLVVSQENVQTTNESTKNVFKEKRHNYEVNKILWLVFKILLLIFLTFSLVRIPYVGAFFDSVIFSLIFGWTKYIAYLFLYLIIILSWFPLWFRKVFKPKPIFIAILIWFLIAIIISAIGVLTVYRQNQNLAGSTSFDKYFYGDANSYLQYWLNNDWSKVSSTNQWFYINPYAYGGLPSFFLVILFEIGSPIILIILSFALISYIFYLIGRKVYKKTSQSRLIKSDSSSSNKLFLVKEKTFNKEKYSYIQPFLKQLEKENLSTPIGKITNLVNVSHDYHSEIEQQANNFITKFDNFFKANNINPKLFDTEIMYQSFTLKYKFLSKSDLRSAKSLISKFKEENFDIEFEYWFEENILFISEKASLQSIIAIKDIIKEIDFSNYYCLGIGKFIDRKVYYVNALYEPNLAIYGSTKGDGRGMLLSNIILSLAIINSKKLVNINLIDLSNKTIRNLSNLPQVSNYYSNFDEAKEFLENLKNKMNQRLELIKRSGCISIHEYNTKNKNTQIMPIETIAINNLDELISWDRSYFSNEFFKLLEKSFEAGFIFIISFGTINDDTLQLTKYFNNIITLRLNSESESNKLIGESYAKYLWGNGDMILKTNDIICRLQSPYVNRDEMNEIINQINENVQNH